MSKTNGMHRATSPHARAVASAVARCLETEAALDALEGDFARIPVEEYVRREREAVSADKHARGELLGILDAIRRGPGTDSAIVLEDGTVVAAAHEGDGLAIARPGSVVRLDRRETRP